jgi:hypothetical protein
MNDISQKNKLQLVYCDRDNVKHVVERMEEMLIPAYRNEFVVIWYDGKPHACMKQRIKAISGGKEANLYEEEGKHNFNLWLAAGKPSQFACQ